MDLKQQKPTMTTVSEEKDVYLDNSDKIITNSISDTEHIHSPDLSKNLNSLKSGNVCESNPGTPVFDISPFSKLPSSNSFSKDIGSMLNFENLPNSIGKYEQMSGLIKKVREAVSKLQEYDV